MLARVPIEGVHQTARRGDLTAATEQIESTQETSNSPRLNVARRHFALPAQHCVHLESGGPAERRALVKPRAPRYAARGCESSRRKPRLARPASTRFRRGSAWVAWLLPRHQEAELP